MRSRTLLMEWRRVEVLSGTEWSPQPFTWMWITDLVYMCTVQ